MRIISNKVKFINKGAVISLTIMDHIKYDIQMYIFGRYYLFILLKFIHTMVYHTYILYIVTIQNNNYIALLHSSNVIDNELNFIFCKSIYIIIERILY